MGSGGGKGGGGGSSDYYRDNEQARQASIREGTAAVDKTFAQFDDAFYNKQQQAYLDYAMPQLERQRADAAKQLQFALARAGRLGGSTAAQQGADLTREYDLQSQNITDQALQYKTDAQSNVAAAKDNLLTTLAATADAGSAADSAIARSKALSAAPAYSPLTDLFASYTDSLGTAYAAQRAYAAAGGTPNSSSATLFPSSSGAVVTR